MREYGQIQCSYWTDPEIQALSDQGKILGAYLMTGPHSNGLGCYRLPVGYVQADFGWNEKRVLEGFDELLRIGFIQRCSGTHFILIPKFLNWNPISNGNVAAARVKEFNAVPKNVEVYHTLISSLLVYGKHFKESFVKQLESLSKGYGKQDPTQPKPTQPKPISPIPAESGTQEIFYKTKKGKKLKGNMLRRFDGFWATFNHKHGKTEAADAWLKLDWPESNEDQIEFYRLIIIAAKKEAAGRQATLDKNLTPKWAEGWLSGRRFEDEGSTSKSEERDNQRISEHQKHIDALAFKYNLKKTENEGQGDFNKRVLFHHSTIQANEKLTA